MESSIFVVENFGQFELFARSDIFYRALIQYISLPEFQHLFFIFYYNFNIFTVHPHLTLQSLKKSFFFYFFSKISVNSVCTSDSLYEIRGLESIEPWLTGHVEVYRDPKRLITSVLPKTSKYDNHTIVWLGTSDGHIIKVMSLFMNDKPKLKSHEMYTLQ